MSSNVFGHLEGRDKLNMVKTVGVKTVWKILHHQECLQVHSDVVRVRCRISIAIVGQ